MRAFPPALEDRHYLVPVLVRVDYSDDAAWRDAVVLLGESFPIQGPPWDGATVEDVLAAAVAHPVLAVVFVADAGTMAAPERPLLAVTTTTPDDEGYHETTRFGREFRAPPRQAREIHLALETLTATFDDYAYAFGARMT
jgi:hypothetical protein